MIGRNVDDHFNKTPTPHYPRSRFDMGIHKRLQTQGHGRLYPFFARIVYPGDTWQMDMTTFVRADTSLRVPLDDIYLDTFWFFIPLRTIDDNFVKILGEDEPSKYDDVSYGFPQFEITGVDDMGSGKGFSINAIFSYLGYNQYDGGYANGKWNYPDSDTICPYALAAYYRVWNSWFRDENVDPSIPYENLYGNTADTLLSNDLFDNFNCLKVNRYHDAFSSGLISPQKGPAQTVLNSNSAPVLYSGTSLGNNITVGSAIALGTTVNPTTETAPLQARFSGNSYGSVVAHLSAANATINDLRLAFAIQALYEKRGTYGTRYIETLRGQWGLEVPDLFLQRPEYLGGSRVTLNNVPVLSTENSSQLGQMSGNSATLGVDGSWSKSFVDYGIILGVSCTRIKHSYTQGRRPELFDLVDQIDLYNPVFANIGKQPVFMKTIFNDPSNTTPGTGAPDDVFNYQEPYWYLRSDIDSFAGLFGTFSSATEIQTKWHYGDYYVNAPAFSASWLKEDYTNVARTMTGQLIAGASNTEVEGHQFMFGYYYHPVVTRILPAHPVPATLLGHL